MSQRLFQLMCSFDPLIKFFNLIIRLALRISHLWNYVRLTKNVVTRLLCCLRGCFITVKPELLNGLAAYLLQCQVAIVTPEDVFNLDFDSKMSCEGFISSCVL